VNGHGAEHVHRIGEATRWLTELRDAPDDATVNRWLRWCEQGAENVRAYQDAQRLWRQFDQVAGDVQEAQARRQPRYRRGVALGVAASLLAVLGAWYLMQPVSMVRETVISGAGRTSILPDGSTLALGARSSVELSFSGQRRMLRLATGQAYFEVQPDSQRPFVVMAGGLEVTAIGTAFDVKRHADRVIVTVQEGVVSVAHAGGPGPGIPPHSSSWRVGAGYQFVYSATDATTTLSSVDTSAVLAWREGRLEYMRAPLAAVLADVSRYAGHPLQFADPADPALARLTFTGTVFTASIDEWITALPGALPVRVERLASGVLIHFDASSAR